MQNGGDLNADDLPDIDDREPLESKDEFDEPPDGKGGDGLGSPIDVLGKYTPDWLGAPMPPPFSIRTARNFLGYGSQVVFYPGSGGDGQAIEIFGGSHGVHGFVHADLHQSVPSVVGYVIQQSEDIDPDKMRRIFDLDVNHPFPPLAPELRGASWVILQRQSGRGPERLATLQVCAEGTWVFWNLFARRKRAPYGILLQDHGWAGNPPGNHWGRGGNLDRLAHEHDVVPKWLLVGSENTHAWPDFKPASDLAAPAGQHGNLRRLWRRQT
jgi:hypothetical protein